jgi:hypothetical protein
MLPRVLTGLLLSTAFAVSALAADPIFVDQGSNWTPDTRKVFYRQDQGARMIPLAWLQALKQANGQPFLADNLARYGYLPNPDNTNGLPVGFTTFGPTGAEVAGMNCAACHTRQITAEGKAYRIDGGPAISDFQTYLTDLDKAVGQILASDAAFQPFAATVLHSATPDADAVVDLRQTVEAWFLRYDILIKRALPSQPWGPARLDAVGMIFNRLTGLDLGAPPSFIIADNIQRADAPVRYPFLWNAPRQDKTQWPGFADNGNDILALSRNLGQVYGVFGIFEPKNDFFFVDFLNHNSANFGGLDTIENLLKQIGPPKWPKEWLIDTNLAAQGKTIFQRKTEQGGCGECHDIRPGTVRFLDVPTWATPVQNVGTDTREYDILAWKADTGVLNGAFVPFITQPLGQRDFAFSILATSVVGSIVEHVLSGGGIPTAQAQVTQPQTTSGGAAPRSMSFMRGLPPALKDLQGAFRPPGTVLNQLNVPLPNAAALTANRGSYESRVLQGIWATAPYLHNGSVPTLAELLKPPAERVKSFKIGNAYDTTNLGLAVEQTQFVDSTLTTTDCSQLNSGNSNCGHDFGTHLSADEKKALLEYLKTL